MPGAGAAEPSVAPEPAASEPAGAVAEPEVSTGFAASFFLPQAANDMATTATTIIIFFM